jgi:hypothetical protein
MSIPVEPAFLYSIRAQASFTWKKMLCEFIDNSFDADANRVQISFPGGKVFRIQDDGDGTDDLMRLITLGRRKDHATNDVGKYGVGCKLALIWLWGTSSIETKTETSSQRLEVHWEKIAEGLANYPESAQSVNVGSIVGTGTKIECRGERCYPKADSLLQSLSSTYTPGIELGKTISVKFEKGNPERVIARQWPKTTKAIDDIVEAAGRPVRIRMGIVSEGVSNPYGEGFSFERTYRVIKETTLGANGFSVSRIAARITLGNEWELSTNKDDFSEFQDELAEAIYDRCAELMSEASEQAVSMEDTTFNKELAEIVADGAKKTRRESRPNKGEQTGTVEPKKTGIKRTFATESTDNDGSVIDNGVKRSRRRGFTIETYLDASGSFTFGRYDADGNRVRLNIANPWLQDMHRNRNRDALLPVVYGILAEASHRQQSEKVPLFTDQLEDLVTQWGTAVASAAERSSQL